MVSADIYIEPSRLPIEQTPQDQIFTFLGIGQLGKWAVENCEVLLCRQRLQI